MAVVGQVFEEKEDSLIQTRCDSGGYYFDRGGRRIFETKYDSYQRGTFNLRRGRMWRERKCDHKKCGHMRRNCKRCQKCVQSNDDVAHEHYFAQAGLVSWPSVKDPNNGLTRTKGYSGTERPIWIRDIIDASGYTSPTSWQGFQ